MELYFHVIIKDCGIQILPYTDINYKDTNRKIRTTFFIDYCVWILVPNFIARHAHYLLYAASIALDFACVYCTRTAAGTIFGTTDVYELGFSYLSISIFKVTDFAAAFYGIDSILGVIHKPCGNFFGHF